MAITSVCCNLTKDLLRVNTCGYSLPRITDLYIANFADVTSSNDDYDCESGATVTAITLASGASFYHIEVAKDSASFTDSLVVEDNGNKYRTHTISFTLNGKYDKNMVPVQDALALGRFYVVVHTADDEYLALASKVGMEATEQSVTGGGDTNGVTVTLSANVTESAIPLNEAAIAVVKGS